MGKINTLGATLQYKALQYGGSAYIALPQSSDTSITKCVRGRRGKPGPREAFSDTGEDLKRSTRPLPARGGIGARPDFNKKFRMSLSIQKGKNAKSPTNAGLFEVTEGFEPP